MKKMFILILIAWAAFQAVSYAESISGKVASVDAATNTLSISRVNPETNAEETVSVAIKTETSFSGVQALADLKEGQEVSVDAAKDEVSGSWNANSVEVKNAEEALAV